MLFISATKPMQETGQLKAEQCKCRLYCRKTKVHQFV